MNRIIIGIALLLLPFFSFGQAIINDIPDFPAYDQLYYGGDSKKTYGEKSNVERFFKDWASWSAKVASNGQESKYNYMFKQHLLETLGDISGKVITLPLYIEVLEYDCKIHNDTLSLMEDILFDKSNIQPISVFRFIPKLDPDVSVMYLHPQADSLVNAFLGEAMTKSRLFFRYENERVDRKWARIFKKRLRLVRKNLPSTMVSHWSEKYYFTTRPCVEQLIVGEDGYYIIEQLNFSCTYWFVTNDGEKIAVEYIME